MRFYFGIINNNISYTEMITVLFILYIIGAVLNLIVYAVCLYKEGEMKVSDIALMVIVSLLSWGILLVLIGRHIRFIDDDRVIWFRKNMNNG